MIGPGLVCIVGASAFVGKDGRHWMNLSLIVDNSRKGSRGYSAVEMLVGPEVGEGVTAVPGVYSTVEEKGVYRGKMSSQVVGVSLVAEGWPE